MGQSILNLSISLMLTPMKMSTWNNFRLAAFYYNAQLPFITNTLLGVAHNEEPFHWRPSNDKWSMSSNLRKLSTSTP